VGVRNWRRKQQYREQLEEFKIHHGLLCQRKKKTTKKRKKRKTGAPWFR
jgi:hypothetical protein